MPTVDTAFTEKRLESRHYIKNTLGSLTWSWKTAAMVEAKPTVLYSVSRNGLSIIIPESMEPEIGEVFRLHCDQTHLTIRCCVVCANRISDSNDVLVGSLIVSKENGANVWMY